MSLGLSQNGLLGMSAQLQDKSTTDLAGNGLLGELMESSDLLHANDLLGSVDEMNEEELEAETRRVQAELDKLEELAAAEERAIEELEREANSTVDHVARQPMSTKATTTRATVSDNPSTSRAVENTLMAAEMDDLEDWNPLNEDPNQESEAAQAGPSRLTRHVVTDDSAMRRAQALMMPRMHATLAKGKTISFGRRVRKQWDGTAVSCQQVCSLSFCHTMG